MTVAVETGIAIGGETIVIVIATVIVTVTVIAAATKRPSNERTVTLKAKMKRERKSPQMKRSSMTQTLSPMSATRHGDDHGKTLPTR